MDPLSISPSSLCARQRPVPDWVLRVFDIHYFWDITEVDLAGRNITTLDPLTALSELEWLDLRDTNVTEEQLERLRAALPECEVLSGELEANDDPFAR
ncbi:MAG: hypothetical protein AAFX06_29270 [Planctomycetota bacterium]